MHDPLFHIRHTLTLLAGMNALGPVSQADLAAAVTDLSEHVDLLAAERSVGEMVTLPVLSLADLAAQHRRARSFTLIEGGLIEGGVAS